MLQELFAYLYIRVSQLINCCCTATASSVFRFTHAHVGAAPRLQQDCADSLFKLAASRIQFIERRHATERHVISTVPHTQGRNQIRGVYRAHCQLSSCSTSNAMNAHFLYSSKRSASSCSLPSAVELVHSILVCQALLAKASRAIEAVAECDMNMIQVRGERESRAAQKAHKAL
jgi:hypothetical protein